MSEEETKESKGPKTYYGFVAMLVLTFVVYYVAGAHSLLVLYSVLPSDNVPLCLAFGFGACGWLFIPIFIVVEVGCLLSEAHSKDSP